MGDVRKRIRRQLEQHPDVRRSLFGIATLLETLLYGGTRREALLVRLLGALHRSQFRREWHLSLKTPHFYNQRWNGFEFTYGRSRSPYGFFRGFLASEVIRDGDCLLDIGCGDSFFSNSFFSEKCRHIDAIDVDAFAIETARRLNSSPKIRFHILDAVRNSFPSECYDVIVWDGAIGHFSQSDTFRVLEKICRSLSPSGIFVGSESLGMEGSDHLQYFESESALAAVLKPYFEHVLIRTAEYRIGEGYARREAYWRCFNRSSCRHESTTWVDFAESRAAAHGSSGCAQLE
ncbi:MAG: class I SAM-dependent methyltransferase [Candidatus Binatia bacterium]|jgi:2-polyprenyl-3-methyl-5-hydroxy-6-metoxy-1,4-benzoquinol methylase